MTATKTATAKAINLKLIVELLEHRYGSENACSQATGIGRTAIRRIKGLVPGPIQYQPSETTLQKMADALATLQKQGTPIVWGAETVLFSEEELRAIHKKSQPQPTTRQLLIEKIKVLPEEELEKIWSSFLDEEPSLSVRQIKTRLDKSYQKNGLFILIALIYAHVEEFEFPQSVKLNKASAGLDKKTCYRLAKFTEQMAISPEIQNRYYNDLVTIMAHHALPQDYIPILLQLARLLKKPDGTPFEGNTGEMLRFCGMIQ